MTGTSTPPDSYKCLVHIGFTGTRRGMTTYQKVIFHRELKNCKATRFIHGGAVGADCEAAAFAFQEGIQLECFPARLGYLPYPGELMHTINQPLLRNKDIVNYCDILIATPGEDQEIVRSGTWMTVRYARRVFRQTIIIYPNGAVQHEQVNLRNTSSGKRSTPT